MAEEAVIYIGKHVSNLIKLVPCDFEELKFFWDLKEELNELRELLDAIADLVEDAEEKQKEMEAARPWLCRVRDTAYGAEELLSASAYERTRLQIQTKEVGSLYLNTEAEKDGYRLIMSHKLQNIIQSLGSIQEEGQRLQLRSIQHNFEDVMSQNRFQTHSILENPVVGRDDDVAKVVNLMTCSWYRGFNVVPIAGHRGLGKRVLAKLVCQTVMARNLYDVEIWVTCGERDEEGKILEKMLQSLNGRRMGGLITGRYNYYQIVEQLKKELTGKRILLVLDGVLEGATRWWHSLKDRLSEICTVHGNVILFTTPSDRSDLIGNPQYERHTLAFLSNDDCWLILKERAFRNVTSPYPPNLETIGREIARKCRGVPLVAKVIGRTLGFYRDEETWFKIRDSLFSLSISDSDRDYERDVLSLLKVCFDHLPSYLKPCFLLSAVCSRRFSIRKKTFVQFWVAGGFAESCDEGSIYFDAFLAHSFFQDAEIDENGEVIQCQMHHLLRNLAVSLCKHGASSYIHVGCSYIIDTLYGLVLDRDRNEILALNKATYCQYSWETERHTTPQFNGADLEVFLSSIGETKHLRNLDLSDSEITEFPNSFATLYNLQFLDLSNSKIKMLSESFTNFYNLQSLNLSSSHIEELPELITKLYNLRTLNLSNTNIKKLPRFIGKLQNLQTLNVSNSNIKRLPGSISDLLSLRILDISNSIIKKLPNSIGKLYNLQTLNVSKSKIKKLPKSITKLYNLQTLKLLDCKELTKLPRKKLRNLVNLKHIAFSYEHQMPSGIGKLYGLETLPLFVVGSDWGGRIHELEWLSKLRGKLEMTRLEEVVDKQEADRANLQGKTDLRELGFYWSYGANNRTSGDEELLEGLRPNANIKRIKIKYYMGEKWPSWMLRMKNPRRVDSFPVLNNLVDLRLEGCWNCVQLPRLGDLASLQFLQINHMNRLKCIGNEFYGIDGKGDFSESEDLRLFPALISLSLSWMENLTEWSSPSDGNRVVVFPRLENLFIQSCAKLTGFPMTDLSGLVNLEIKDCDEFRSIFEQPTLPFLTSLSIEGCSKLTCFENRFALGMDFRKFSVRRCEWMTFIPQDLWKLRCLTSLEMYWCKRLRSFSEEILCNLTQLKILKIGAFSKELDDFCYLYRIPELKHLEELEIWGSDFFGRKMSYLPEEVRLVTSLKSLKIMGFTTMEALPRKFPYLQSLQSLSLNYCRHLECESTATILPRLSSLTHLYIHCCPALNKSKLESLLLLEGAEIKVEFSNV